ncbi:hypothetical protein MUO93_03795, partial [Candidatus Bathyarchaeota archaeon]|nr:hypothetical protein [Candidatus Bathyarchaeota archaeon]
KRIEIEVRRIGGPRDSEREELLDARAALEGELERLRDEIEKGFDPLPLLLAGPLLGALRWRLEQEERVSGSPQDVEDLRLHLRQVRERVFDRPVPEPPPDVALSPEQARFYVRRYDEACDEVFSLGSTRRDPLLHDIGHSGRQEIIQRIDAVRERGSYLRGALDRRETVGNELREVEKKVRSTSDDPAVQQLLDQLKAISESIGHLDEEHKRLIAEVQQDEASLATRARQIRDREERREATNEAFRSIKLARKVQDALDAFVRRLAPEKLKILQGHLEEMYWRLRKPEDPVSRIRIDPQTWEVLLLDDQDRPLERRQFSAGMREIYALSLLWALSRASGRDLPIVIDTPLGRLDSYNRESLCRNYFPNAGHQVIILSTDEEVDREWFELLRDKVATQYCLEYDERLKSTVVRPGYFF